MSKDGNIEHTLAIDAQTLTLNVPLRLMEFALREKKTQQFKLYLYLKFHSSGKVLLSTQFKTQVALDIHLSIRRINELLQELKKINWLGYNYKTRMYYVRGFNTVCQLHKFNAKHAFEISKDWITQIKEFCLISYIAYILVNRRWRDRMEKKLDKNGRSWLGQKNTSPFQSQYDLFDSNEFSKFMVPSPFLGRQLKMSISTISALKKKAVATGYLEVRENFKCISENPDIACAINQYRRSCPDIEGKLSWQDEKLFYHSSDSFKTHITFKNRYL